jgi:hypothetical protein
VKFGKLDTHKELEGIDWTLPECKIEWRTSENNKHPRFPVYSE